MDLNAHRWGVVAPDWAANALVVQEYESHEAAETAAKDAARLSITAVSPVGSRSWKGLLPLVYDDGGWIFYASGAQLQHVTDWAVA